MSDVLYLKFKERLFLVLNDNRTIMKLIFNFNLQLFRVFDKVYYFSENYDQFDMQYSKRVPIL